MTATMTDGTLCRGSGPLQSSNQTQCPPGKHSLNTTQEAGR